MKELDFRFRDGCLRCFTHVTLSSTRFTLSSTQLIKEGNRLKFIHDKLGSTNLAERILWSLILFFTIFFTCVTLSYYFLPEGLLKNKNPLQNWETSENMIVCALQIFFYNAISVLVIVSSSLFGQKKMYHKNYLSIGYVTFFALIILNGIVLGTWSFSVENVPVPLIERFLRTFDLVHRAGLFEMLGQLFITCATAHIGIILTNGKVTETKQLRSIRLAKAERFTMGLGVGLMMIGAAIESIAIHSAS